MAGQGFVVTVDVSDLSAEIDRLRSVMKPQQFERCMYGIFRKTGNHVKTILRKDLPQQYEVKPKQISAAVMSPKVSTGAGGVGCIIPITDHRGSVGGRYRAAGGARGWEATRRKYRVRTRVVKGHRSTLPKRMPGSYGGNPPFRNLSAPRLNGVAFTRKTKARFPIMKVMSMSIPQMPMNRSQDDVQNDIKEYMQKEIAHRFQYFISSGR